MRWKDIGGAFLTSAGVLTKAMMPDLLHLGKPAHRTWADQIVGDIDRMLGR